MDKQTFVETIMHNACGVHFAVDGGRAGIEPFVEDGVWYWQIWYKDYACELWGIDLTEVMEMPLWGGRTLTALLPVVTLRYM